VQNDGDVKPAFSGPDGGEIGQPLLVGGGRLEIPVEDVVGDLTLVDSQLINVIRVGIKCSY